MGMSLSKIWEMVKDREGWHAQFMEFQKGPTWLNNSHELFRATEQQ